MLKMKMCGLWVVSLLFAITTQAAGLTQAEVETYLAKMDKAVQQRNVRAVSELMSDQADVVINLTLQGQSQVLSMTKEQYIEMLGQGWSAASDYSYQTSGVVIKINGDHALIFSQVHEKMTIQGQVISTSSKEEARVERVGGKLLATRIVAYTQL